MKRYGLVIGNNDRAITAPPTVLETPVILGLPRDGLPRQFRYPLGECLDQSTLGLTNLILCSLTSRMSSLGILGQCQRSGLCFAQFD